MIFLPGPNLSYALDWKTLHEKADQLTLTDALADVRARPDSVDDLYVLGMVYLNFHRDEEAAEVFDKILSIDPGAIEAKWGVAEVLRRRHQQEKSQELLLDIVKARPDFPNAYITLAYIRYTQSNFTEALQWAIKVLRLGEKNVDPTNHVRAHLIYGGAKSMIAYYGGPISKIVNGTAILPNLKAAEKLQPDSAEVKFALGSFYLLAPSLAGGNLAKAEDYLNKAVETDPLFTDAYVRLGQLYEIQGHSSKSNEYLTKALTIDPQNELALDIKSGKCRFICVGKGRYKSRNTNPSR